MRVQIDSNLVAANFAAFQNNGAVQESAQLFARGLPVAEMLQALAMNRNVLATFAGFEAIYPHGNLERGILEKVILCVSQRNACQFCVNSHLDVTRRLGIPNSGADDPAAPGHSPRERLAIEYATAIHTDSNRVPDALLERLREVFTEPEIVELTFLAGFINLLNWFNNALEVRYNGEFGGMTVA